MLMMGVRAVDVNPGTTYEFGEREVLLLEKFVKDAHVVEHLVVVVRNGPLGETLRIRFNVGAILSPERVLVPVETVSAR